MRTRQGTQDGAIGTLKPPGVSTRDWLRDRISERILHGHLSPGSKLAQQSLAKEYRVGQGMIREAMLQLQQYGMVESVENRGFFVPKLDLQKFLDAYELREVLEGLAVRRCCRRATPAQLDEMTAMADRIYELGQKKQYREMGLLDRDLHDRLVEIAGNELLSEMVRQYRFVIRKIVWGRGPTERVEEILAATHDEHIGILAAIRQNQPDQAEQRMRDHIRKVRLENEEKIRKGEFHPEWIL
jgi:DNA-binding GntR family transcriptional regulator